MVTRNAASMGNYGAAWEARGYCGVGNVTDLINSLQNRAAIVVGNAAGVFYELEKAMLKIEDPIVFAVNDVGMYLPKLDHWVSLHADNLGPWKQVRWLHPIDGEHTKYHSVDRRPYLDYVWDKLTPCMALSGYFAMQIAYIMGAKRIVLCGCPGNATRRFFDGAPRADFSYGDGQDGSEKGIREQLIKEMNRLPEFKKTVRSMSGFTRDFFGGIDQWQALPHSQPQK
jgi:hypothetical protein